MLYKFTHATSRFSEPHPRRTRDRRQRPEETDHLAVHTDAGGFYYMMTRKEMSNSSDTAHAVLAYAGTRDRPDDPVRVWGGHASGPDVTCHYAANRRGVSGTRDAFASRISGGIARYFMGSRPRPCRSSPRCFPTPRAQAAMSSDSRCLSGRRTRRSESV